MTFGRSISCAALAVALATTPNDARAAAPSAETVATARELYKQGADALDAKDAKTAVEKLTAAWSLVQTPVIGYDLARAHLALGHWVEAREAALAVVRTNVASDETDRSARARTDATKLAEQLEPRIPHLVIRITNLAADRTATVKIDGVVVPNAALSVPRQANPGPHIATIEVDDGRHVDGSVTLAEHETKDLLLALPPPSADVPPPVTKPPTTTTTTTTTTTATPPTTPPASPPPPPDTRRGVSPLVWVGVAAGGAGLAVGAIFGALALSAASTVKTNCTLKVGADTVCPNEYSSDLSAARTFGTVSTIGFITAGVGVGLFVTGLILGGGRTSATTARIVPILGPVSGVGGTF